MPVAQTAEPLVFISAFAPGTNGAILAFQLNPTTGVLKPLHRTEGVENPFFMVVSRDQKFLYSIHAKSFGGKEPEHVAAYAIEGRTGRLKLLNRQSTRGTASCYLDVDATGKIPVINKNMRALTSRQSDVVRRVKPQGIPPEYRASPGAQPPRVSNCLLCQGLKLAARGRGQQE
ncbi:MAG: hypothetical protein EB034_18045 [Verrucomicrobia bacterium]|nr:hypothetical protein [Verrucomicrobiota bacterium]